MKRNKTAAQVAYNKELKALQRRIKTAEQRGYIISEDIAALKHRKYSSNVAANRSAVAKMQKLTSEMLRRYSTGVVVGSEAEKDLLKQEAKQAAAEEKALQQWYKKQETLTGRAKRKGFREKEKELAALNNREANTEHAQAVKEKMINVWIDKVKQGWEATYEDSKETEFEDYDFNYLEKLNNAMNFVFTLGRYSQDEIFNWANDHCIDMMRQILESDQLDTTSSTVKSNIDNFIEYLKENWRYEE